MPPSGKKKPQISVSLPCIALSYFSAFTAVGFVLWVVPFLLIFDEGENSITLLALQTFSESAKHLDLSIRTRLDQASLLNQAHRINYEEGIVAWSVEGAQEASNYAANDVTVGPEVNWTTAVKEGRRRQQEEGFRVMLRTDIVVNQQFEFVSLNYEYQIGSWGFCGWYGKDKFYYTNQNGTTLILSAPDGNVNWTTPLYTFYANNTGSPWVSVPQSSPTGRAWTPVYVVEYEETGVDLYASNGHYFVFQQKQYVFEVDVNLKYISSLLKNGTNGCGTAFMFERKTGFLVGTSTSDKLYNRLDTPPAAQDSNLCLVLATSSPDLVVSQASKWLENSYQTLEKTESGSYTLTIDGTEYFMIVSSFVEEEGIDWILVQMKPSSYFLEDIRQSRVSAIVVPICVYLFVLLVTAFITFVIVKKAYIVYQSALNEETYPADDLPVSQDL